MTGQSFFACFLHVLVACPAYITCKDMIIFWIVSKNSIYAGAYMGIAKCRDIYKYMCVQRHRDSHFYFVGHGWSLWLSLGGQANILVFHCVGHNKY